MKNVECGKVVFGAEKNLQLSKTRIGMAFLQKADGQRVKTGEVTRTGNGFSCTVDGEPEDLVVFMIPFSGNWRAKTGQNDACVRMYDSWYLAVELSEIGEQTVTLSYCSFSFLGGIATALVTGMFLVFYAVSTRRNEKSYLF